MEQSKPNNPGKSMGVAGLVLGIVALLVGLYIFLVCVGWAAFEGGLGKALGLAIGWTVLSLIAFMLGRMGMKKNKDAGEKPGVSKGAMIVGILAILYSLGLIAAVFVAHNAEMEATVKADAEMKALMSDTAAIKSSDDAAQHMIDSMNAANNAGADTTHK